MNGSPYQGERERERGGGIGGEFYVFMHCSICSLVRERISLSWRERKREIEREGEGYRERGRERERGGDVGTDM